MDADPASDLLNWFVPYAPMVRGEMPKTILRGLSVTSDVFQQIVEMFNPDADLTRAEKRVCFQFLRGQSLKDAAKHDAVGLETKRIQIKSAISKLGCSGQVEFVRLLVGQMIHLVHMSERDTNELHLAEGFAADHLPPEVRISVQRLRNGRLLRFFDLGPITGRPVLMVHGFMFAFAPLNAAKYLETHNIRLMIPVRAGYLDEQTATDLYRNEDAVEQTIEDLTLYLDHCWGKPITLMGEMLGNPVAFHLAKRRPDLVDRLIVLCINTAPGDAKSESFARRYHGGLRQLVSRPTFFRFLAWQFRSFNRSAKTMRTSITRIARECPADIAAAEGEKGSGPAYDWMVDVLRASPVGIADDYRAVVLGKWADGLSSLDVPLDFIHGEQCSMTSLDDVRALMAQNPDAGLHVIKGAGHFATATHPEEVWGITNTLLRL